MKNYKALTSIILSLGIGISLFGQPNEYLIKGVLLEKFTRFVDWPATSDVNDSSKPFVIGVIGKSPFNPDLETLYKNRTIKGKQVEVNYISRIDDADDCDLLYIAASEKNKISNIINHLKYQPILTISDSDNFSGKGVIINLSTETGKIRFEIDESAIHNTGLHMSHLLLKEAEIIHPLRKTQ